MSEMLANASAAIEKLVAIIKQAIETLGAFIDGFKKDITIGYGESTTVIEL